MGASSFRTLRLLLILVEQIIQPESILKIKLKKKDFKQVKTSHFFQIKFLSEAWAANRNKSNKF